MTRPVWLLVDYDSPAGDLDLVLPGKAKVERGGAIVVVARYRGN